jgi:hypothetical protein
LTRLLRACNPLMFVIRILIISKSQSVCSSRSAVTLGGTRWRSLLRHCATGRKVAGTIPFGVITIFHSCNPSGRTMTDRNEYQVYFLLGRGGGGKGGRCVGLTNLPPSCADCLESWEPQPPGNLRACSGPAQRLHYLCYGSYCLFSFRLL